MLPEPPQNGEYLVAAYVVTVVILVGYFAMLWRKARIIAAALARPKRDD
jgi:hypothetical protein